MKDNSEEVQKICISGPYTQNDISYKLMQSISSKKSIDMNIIENPIKLSLFEEQCNIRLIDKEFEIIRKLTETSEHKDKRIANKSNIKQFLRYSDVIPFSHSIVTLEKENPQSVTFINANYIDSIFENDRKFIATQGPLEITCSHFWRMIRKENSKLIIMLTNINEKGFSGLMQMKCYQYWPDELSKKLKFENFSIENKEQIKLSEDCLKTKLELTYLPTNESSEINHIQCKSWPDHEVPNESQINTINCLLQEIKEERDKFNSKIVIHCSAGIGRTGTLIGIYNCIFAIEEMYNRKINNNLKQTIETFELYEPSVSVFGVVRRLREQRFGMVQTEEQYKYIYNFVKMWILQNKDKILINNIIN